MQHTEQMEIYFEERVSMNLFPYFTYSLFTWLNIEPKQEEENSLRFLFGQQWYSPLLNSSLNIDWSMILVSVSYQSNSMSIKYEIRFVITFQSILNLGQNWGFQQKMYR